MVGFEDHTDETGMLISRESTAELGELVLLVRIVRCDRRRESLASSWGI